MEDKKTKKADLESKKGLFFQIGLVVILAVVLWAFNYKSYDKKEFVELAQDAQEVIEEFVIQTAPEDTPPPPPEQQQQLQSETLEIDDNVSREDEYRTPTGEAVNANLPPPPPPTISTETEVDERHIFEVVEEQPVFIGGDEALLKYLASNIKYPDYAKENNIQGKVYINFVVEKDGSISTVTVKRDIGGGCGVEAVRVVKAMPKWKPGKQRDKAVRVSFTLPVTFRLR